MQGIHHLLNLFDLIIQVIVRSSTYNNFSKYKWHHLEVVTSSCCTQGVGPLKSYGHNVWIIVLLTIIIYSSLENPSQHGLLPLNQYDWDQWRLTKSYPLFAPSFSRLYLMKCQAPSESQSPSSCNNILRGKESMQIILLVRIEIQRIKISKGNSQDIIIGKYLSLSLSWIPLNILYRKYL